MEPLLATCFNPDTIHVKATCKEKKPMARLGGGLVVFDVCVINQDGKIVQRGDWQVLVASKPEQ